LSNKSIVTKLKERTKGGVKKGEVLLFASGVGVGKSIFNEKETMPT
jgi:KaiC/GvpD/RAD55 family RecA-like ATPase